MRKDTDRIGAYGDLDELNAVIGALAASRPIAATGAELQAIQSDLFHRRVAGDHPGIRRPNPSPSTPAMGCARKRIDPMKADLSALKTFILPGGHPTAAWSHVARTVCRRVERRVVRLAGDPPPGEAVAALGRAMVYLNRLSDYLFVFARYCNRRHGIADTPWKA